MTEEASYSLIVSFPDQSESFVLGFEAGGLWQRMRAGDRAEISETVHAENRDVIARMAAAEGWEVATSPTAVPGWDTIRMTKVKAAPDRPNPQGLRIVK